MAAYAALTHTVNDVDKYVGEYVPQVLPLLEKYGIEILAAEFGTQAVEGDANSVIMLKAPSVEALQKFYAEPDYAEPLKLRHSITSDRTMVAAPEFAGLPS